MKTTILIQTKKKYHCLSCCDVHADCVAGLSNDKAKRSKKDVDKNQATQTKTTTNDNFNDQGNADQDSTDQGNTVW